MQTPINPPRACLGEGDHSRKSEWWRGPTSVQARKWAPSVSLRLPPPRAGEDLRQQTPRRRLVVTHFRDQRFHVLELAFITDEGMQRDLDLPAVEIAVELEQMRLEQLARRLERRADAEAGDARKLAAVIERHPHRVDAVPRP